MHSSNFILLLAGSAAAQSTVTILNLIYSASTLTFQGSDAQGTTYVNVCSSSAGLISGSAATAAPAASSKASSIASRASGAASAARKVRMAGVTAAPNPLPRANLRRQQSSSANGDDEDDCEPYTIIQGSETWQFHMTDPTPGVWTVDGNCNWKGALTTADITCTAAQKGSEASLLQSSGPEEPTSTVFNQQDVLSYSLLDAVTIVSATSSRSGSGSGTSSSPTGSAASGATSSSSKGVAPAMAIPTGAMAFVGGAAGFAAAALAL